MRRRYGLRPGRAEKRDLEEETRPRFERVELSGTLGGESGEGRRSGWERGHSSASLRGQERVERARTVVLARTVLLLGIRRKEGAAAHALRNV